MSYVGKTTLKGYFNAGDVPTESNFADLVDSCHQGHGSFQLVASESSDTAITGDGDATGGIVHLADQGKRFHSRIFVEWSKCRVQARWYVYS